MKLKIKDNEKLTLMFMLIFSWIIILIFTFLSNSNSIIIILYGLSAIIGIISIRYTYIMIILSLTVLFSLFSTSNLAIGSMNDFAIISTVFCLITQLVKSIKINNLKIKKWILSEYIFIFFILLLFFISIFVANRNFGQPIINGIMSYRYLIILLIIPILSNYFKENKKEQFILEKYLSYMIIISIFCVTIQFFLRGRIDIFKLFWATRGGEYRVLMHNVTTLYCILYGVKLYRILLGKKRYFIDFLTIVSILFVTCFITQTRTCLLMLIAITFLELCIAFRKKANTVMLIICIIGLLLVIFAQLGYFDSIIQKLFNDILTQGDSYIRNECVDFYMDLIPENGFLLGGGITNENYKMSPINLGNEKGYFLVDIGVFGFFFEYGIFGIIAILMIMIMIIWKTIKNKNESIRNTAVIFSIFIIATFYTTSPISNSNLVVLIIVQSFLNSYYYAIKQK